MGKSRGLSGGVFFSLFASNIFFNVHILLEIIIIVFGHFISFLRVTFV